MLPIGDIQYAGEGSSTAIHALQRHIEWGVKNKAHFVGMGDYVDFASPSNRQRLAGAALYDTAVEVIELAADNLTKELYKRCLEPSRDRWLGLLEGHHYYQYAAGMTTDMQLCDLLRTQHLGSCAYVRLVFEDRNGRSKKTGRTRIGNVTLWVHHGTGSGRRASAPLNTLDQLPIYWDADIYLMGHQSKKVVAPLQRVLPVWRGNCEPHLQHRTIFIAGTGSFSRAYIPGNRHGRVPRGDYVEQKMLNPAALGGIKIKIIPQWIREDGIHGKDGARHWQPEISIEQ